jgi:hypothetical protein
MNRQLPKPPHPEIARRPCGPFGWIDDRMLSDGWLARVGADAVAVLVLLVLAADRRGASFYGRDRMAAALGLDRCRVDAALEQLLDHRLVAMRPWRPGHRDGVWQLLPVPQPAKHDRSGDTMPVADILRQLGIADERKT